MTRTPRFAVALPAALVPGCGDSDNPKLEKLKHDLSDVKDSAREYSIDVKNRVAEQFATALDELGPKLDELKAKAKSAKDDDRTQAAIAQAEAALASAKEQLA